MTGRVRIHHPSSLMTDIADFDYDLPAGAIAQTPVEPRHASRLLDTRDLSDHVFLDLPELLSAGDLVVVNGDLVFETGGVVKRGTFCVVISRVWCTARAKNECIK